MTDIRVLCIAGGSGCGKSTLAEALAATLGDDVTVLGLDEYQKRSADVPHMPNGRPNYDHPDAVDFPRFVADLTALRAGRAVQLARRHKCATMDGGVQAAAIITLSARPLIVVEGYLALCSSEARSLYDCSIFLDLPDAARVARRRWAKDAEYVEQVLLPMHAAHIEPTKRFADLVIDVATADRETVLDAALRFLRARGIVTR